MLPIRRVPEYASTFGVQGLDTILSQPLKNEWEKWNTGDMRAEGGGEGEGMPLGKVYQLMNKGHIDFFRDSTDENVRNIVTAHEAMKQWRT